MEDKVLIEERMEHRARWLGLSAVILLLPLLLGGCPRPEDDLEPNDTPGTATVLTVGQAVVGRVVQGNPDVFAVTAGPEEIVVFAMESLGEEEADCAAFTVTGPDETVLYQDRNTYCGRYGTEPIVVEGAALEEVPGFGFELRVPAASQGRYVLTVVEKGQVDNIFTFSWQYSITATVE